MKRYNEILQYFSSENSSGMDVDRFINIAEHDISHDLEMMKEDSKDMMLSVANHFFKLNSTPFLYLYAWKLYFRGERENDLLCNAVAFSSIGLFCGYGERPGKKYFFDDRLYDQGIRLIVLMVAQRIDIARLCYPYFIEGIKRFEPMRAKHFLPQKMIVLVIEMLASEHKQTIDWYSSGIPVDRFYSEFVKEALYSQDEAILKEWLMALCDNHLKWSARTESTEDEYADDGYEIEARELLLWPFEYQAVKNFRAEHGLSTPVIDHPLLKTPLAI